MSSLYFQGTTGRTIPIADFDPQNRTMHPERHNYHGHWIFCRFDDEEILGARFGFGMGTFDLSDYGIPNPTDCSFVMRHFEIMTREGAYVWLGSGRNMAKDLSFARDGTEFRMVEDGRESFRVAGWPDTQWRYQTPDDEMALDLRVASRDFTLLPDAVMEHNLFAMWVANAACSGEIRLQGRRFAVSGHAFYDHSRINQVWNAIVPFGWSIYLPMHFADGSSLVLFHCRDRQGNKVRSYNFGSYVDASGKGTWIPDSEITDMTFDRDDWPDSWSAGVTDGGLSIRIRCTVQATPVRKAWGPFPIAQTRKENFNIPLPCDGVAEVSRDGARHTVSGKGLAEYLSFSRMQSLGA